MIDDGRYDPAEKKIENHERALNDFIYWERELRPTKPKRQRRRLSDRLWSLLEAMGNSYRHGGF
jgi:hypothetical protein